MKRKMVPNEFPTQIAVYSLGIKLIVPGYTDKGEFGYFVCEQKKIKSRNTIKYCKISHFIPNGEDAFQKAIDAISSIDDV